MFWQVVLLFLLSLVRGSIHLSGPCRVWLLPCGSGDWRCTSVEAYQDFIRGPLPFCPSLNTTSPPLPARYCSLIDGVCQFTSTTPNCTTWFDHCRIQLDCGTTTEQALSHSMCFTTPEPLLQPRDLCIPSNESCEWYNPCRMWPGLCQGPYHCGSVDDYYQFTNGPQPLCAAPPPDWVEPTPPGQCLIHNGQCSWSNCTAWLDWCHTGWQCGTQYDEALYRAGPPPPCPPPRDNSLPLQPGRCAFDLNLGTCRWFDPCTLVDCAPNSDCRVSSSGEAECIANCEGGCRQDQTCQFVDLLHGSYTACVDTPNVPCSSTITNQLCGGNGKRCLVQNKTKESFCVDSCFQNNGGCGIDQVCYSEADDHCHTQTDYGQCSTHAECVEVEDLKDYKCPPGWEYSQCGSACEPTCESYLSVESQFRACPAVCVEGCFCKEGLIGYRDRCVDSRECYSLVNDPPPINPLPVKADVTLISLNSPSASLSDFKQHANSGQFVYATRSLIYNVTSDSSVNVHLHGYYHDEEGLQIVVKVEVSSPMNIPQLVRLLRANIDQLPLHIESVHVVETQVITQSSGSLSGAAIGGMVVGVVVVLLTVVVTAILITAVILLRRRNQRKVAVQTKVDVLVTYAKLDDEKTTETEVKLPIDESGMD